MSPVVSLSSPIGLSLGENLVNPDLGEVAGPGEVGGEVDGEVGDLVVVLGLDVVVGQDDSVGEPDDEDVVVASISQIRLNFISLPFLQKYRERETSS